MANKKFLTKLLAPVIFGLLIFLLPVPDGLTVNTWIFVSIFAALILGLMLEPIPPAYMGLIAIVLAVLFKVGPAKSGLIDAKITAAQAINWGLSGFSNAVVWLIFSAFAIGMGFSKTGLGERIALWLVSKLGKKTLGLGFAIAIADLILAPFIPSNAARSGGTVYPVIMSISKMFESTPEHNPRKIGAFLVWVGCASACVSSSIFLTGQAPNPLALGLIQKQGVSIVDWLSWFLAFLPVGIILFIITPILAFFLFPPELKGSSEVAKWADNRLKELGSMTRKQIIMIFIAIFGLVLWIGSSYFKINATTTALMIIVFMVAFQIITWDDFLSNKTAWGTLVWFSTLVAMAAGLKNVGFLDWLAGKAEPFMTSLTPFVAVVVLLIFFSFLRYFFASGTAYVTAMVVLFVGLAQSIPNTNVAQTMLILCLPMGFMGIITPYGTGCSPLWFGSGYIKGPKFFMLGGIFALIYMAIYLVVGLPWLEFIMPNLTFLTPTPQ